ncbi:hypothetical protein ACHAPG_007738 [Botrytis cinerea]
MFSEENGFKDHLEKRHSDTFESHQLHTLADASKRPPLAAFSNCPFCGAAPEDLVKSDHDISVNLDTHMINERANIKTRDSRFVTSKAVENLQRHIASHLRQRAIMALPSRDDLSYSKSVPSTGCGHSKSDIFDIFDTEIDEIEPSPFVETHKRSADIPFKDNTFLWREVFTQIPEDQRGGDLKLNDVLTGPIPPDQFHRTNSTGALECDYRYPVLENQQSTNRSQIELAGPVYVASRMDSIDDHGHETTPKSALVSPALANSYYKTPGPDYSVSTSLSNRDPSNVSWLSLYFSANDTMVSSNTSWAPSKYSALSEDSTISNDSVPSRYSTLSKDLILSKDLAPSIKSTLLQTV